MAALVRAWGRKIKRPQRVYAMPVGPDAFQEASVITNGNHKLLAAFFRAGAKAQGNAKQTAKTNSNTSDS